MKLEDKTQNEFMSALANALTHAMPTDRTSFMMVIKNYLSETLVKIIDSHNTNSAIFILACKNDSMLLKAEFGNNTAIHKEVQWYEHLAKLDSSEAKLFLGAVKNKGFALLLLHYIDGAITLDEWAKEHPAKTDDFSSMVLEMLHYDSSLFHKTARLATHDTVEQLLIKKYKARRKEAAEAKYLDKLLLLRSININGKNFLTPDFAFEKLMSDPKLSQRLIPKRIGLIHGDLHTGNALIGNGKLYYVDPNGNLEMPLEYDIAKLLHSVHGQYPVIMHGKYEIKSHEKSAYEFSLTKERIYTIAHEKLRDELDHELYLRSLHIEALHFATMLPHHAQNQNETTALFLRSTQLFGELFSILGQTN